VARKNLHERAGSWRLPIQNPKRKSKENVWRVSKKYLAREVDMDMFSSEITKQLVSWIVILITRVVQSKRMFFSSQLWSVLLVSDFQFSLATFKFIQICSRARFGFSCLQRTEWPCLNRDLIIVSGSRIFVFKMDRVLVENSFKEINTKWFKAKK